MLLIADLDYDILTTAKLVAGSVSTDAQVSSIEIPQENAISPSEHKTNFPGTELLTSVSKCILLV